MLASIKGYLYVYKHESELPVAISSNLGIPHSAHKCQFIIGTLTCLVAGNLYAMPLIVTVSAEGLCHFFFPSLYMTGTSPSLSPISTESDKTMLFPASSLPVPVNVCHAFLHRYKETLYLVLGRTDRFLHIYSVTSESLTNISMTEVCRYQCQLQLGEMASLSEESIVISQPGIISEFTLSLI